jgi:hypothetical protein
MKSPAISSYSWGNVLVDEDNRYKDVKLYPGGHRGWDWNETGTHHRPGILVADVEELLEHGAEQVILSSGFFERLQVADETREFLTKKRIAFERLQTEKAVKRYNELRQKHAVGALIHSTC